MSPPWQHTPAAQNPLLQPPNPLHLNLLPARVRVRTVPDGTHVKRQEKCRKGGTLNPILPQHPHCTHDNVQSHTVDIGHCHKHCPASMIPISTLQIHPSSSCGDLGESLNPLELCFLPLEIEMYFPHLLRELWGRLKEKDRSRHSTNSKSPSN